MSPYVGDGAKEAKAQAHVSSETVSSGISGTNGSFAGDFATNVGGIDVSGLKSKYDISNVPDHIQMAKGQKYQDMADAEKYAIHMTSEAMGDAFTKARTITGDAQINEIRAGTNKAVWYSNPKSKRAWNELPTRYAQARNTSGENIQFNDETMMRLLPGGPGIQGGMSKALKGYVSLSYYGLPAGQRAFRFIVAHELGHTTNINKTMGYSESNASLVDRTLFGAF